MFKDINKNIKMLEGSYKKLKSYYYYNKNFIIMREKIAEFESSEKNMTDIFNLLAKTLAHPTRKSSVVYLEKLIGEIGFYSLPKKFKASRQAEKNKPITNTLDKHKQLKTLNFFINMPIELHILDALWTLFVAKAAYDLKIISDDVYGNTVMSNIVSSNKTKDNINYDSRRLFNLYFYQYTNWRNNAFNRLEKNFDNKKNSLLIAMDLQSYFYAIKFDFDKYEKLLAKAEIMSKASILSNVMKKVFVTYKHILSDYRKDLNNHTNSETPLPIGMFSSMVLGNIYLSEFDNNASECNNLSYYGRYVDDLLFVFDINIEQEDTNDTTIQKTLIENKLLEFNDNKYTLKGYRNLVVQEEKIKLIYINHTESKAIIDIYNENIRIVPSQTDPIPNFDFNISYFSESAYSVANFNKQNKIREIGDINLNAYNISLFFSNLIMKYSRIDSYSDDDNQVEDNILQINEFFTGSQCIEYYSNWMNYIYFLVITQRSNELKAFIKNATSYINTLGYDFTDKSVYKKTEILIARTKEYINKHLQICLSLALCLDIEMTERHFQKDKNLVIKYINANIFNHSLIAFPLSNYLEYKKPPSYLKMELKDIDICSNIEDIFKRKWSPRFIHYDELLLLDFYNKHNNCDSLNNKIASDETMDKFMFINDLNYLNRTPFKIEETVFDTMSSQGSKYILREIKIQNKEHLNNIITKFNVSVASLKLKDIDVSLDKEQTKNRWKYINFSKKKILIDIITETYKCTRKLDPYTPSLLVFPELSIPVYWLQDLIKLAKSTQIAIIAGMQYVTDSDGRAYNYILSIFPFQTGKYKNVFFYIREKNDYAPQEKIELAKANYFCVDNNIADYQIFNWCKINLSAFVCYEFTDIFARALLKGKCDIIAAPVFNKDTTYFSNIIDASTRDLHAFIAQSNTSIFGDSRVTGPYDRDHKDIFKIKGGENDNVLIGSIDLGEYYKFQSQYYPNLKKSINNAKINLDSKDKKCSKPDIKPISARYENERTKNNHEEK